MIFSRKPAGTADVKQTIALHRSYRRIKLTRSMKESSAITLFVVLLILVAKIYLLPGFTLEISLWLSQLFEVPLDSSAVHPLAFWSSTSFHFLVVPIASPSTSVCLIVIACSLLSLFFLKKLPISLPLVILINLLLTAPAFFALLFLLIPEYFTYRPASLSELFTTVSVLVETGLPVIFWLVLFPLPVSLLRKICYIVFFECVLMLLYVFKYLVFMVLCTYGTYLVIPLIILILCSLPDILYMVCLFSVTVSEVSGRIAKDTKLWRWA